MFADEVKSQALLIEKLKHKLASQNRHRFGVRSKRHDQLNLTIDKDEAIGEAAVRLTNAMVAANRHRDYDNVKRYFSRLGLRECVTNIGEILFVKWEAYRSFPVLISTHRSGNI